MLAHHSSAAAGCLHAVGHAAVATLVCTGLCEYWPATWLLFEYIAPIWRSMHNYNPVCRVHLPRNNVANAFAKWVQKRQNHKRSFPPLGPCRELSAAH